MYLEEEIKKDHPVFSMKPTSVTKHMGIPMMVRKCPSDMEWSKGAKFLSSDPYNNQMATIMNINADPADKGFGFTNLRKWDLGGVEDAWQQVRQGLNRPQCLLELGSWSPRDNAVNRFFFFLRVSSCS